MTMIELFQIAMAWLGTPRGINALFALVCAAAMVGLNVRLILAASTLLYLALVIL